jgi:vesicle coat complex subunit
MRILAPSPPTASSAVKTKNNGQLKKFLHFYWELCPNYDDDGKLKQMVLVMYVFNSSKHMTLLIAHIAKPYETIL